MIRNFELFRKLNFMKLSAKDMFIQAMKELNLDEHKCPFCLTQHPDWKKHDDYDRYLISFMNGCNITDSINITTFKCQSCGHTHALLPEFIIPYQAYSFIFILLVMRDYFMGRHACYETYLHGVRMLMLSRGWSFLKSVEEQRKFQIYNFKIDIYNDILRDGYLNRQLKL